MKIVYPIKQIALTTTFALAPLLYPTVLKAQSNDVFEKTEQTSPVPPQGTTAGYVLKKAPSPIVNIEGKDKKATIVIDLSKNVLYKYDEEGKPDAAYLVASGKNSTPTTTGIRVVSHVETYPYRNAPPRTKRRRNPDAYGPKIIILSKVDPYTGERSQIGEFIHGNNDETSLGKYASQGCIRMDNDVITDLAQVIKSGNLVKIIR